MSLETQISALVSAANKLTSEVANKMKGIDTKVDQTAVDIIDRIAGSRVFSFFVDSENGNDENKGDSAAPLQTLKRAMSLCPAGSTVEIFVASSQLHTLEDNAVCRAQQLIISSWTRNAVEENYYIDATTPIVRIGTRFNFHGNSIGFGNYRRSIVLELVGQPDFQFFGTASFISYGAKVIIDKSTLSLPVLGSGNNTRMPVKVSLMFSDIEPRRGYLSNNEVILSVREVTGFSYADEIVMGASDSSVLTTMPISAS